ncbi:MAG: hypothetical protein H6R16_449 [Proteobacteria bacterium]|nr:hypothetical protein [Pseudomonadota bacterium]
MARHSVAKTVLITLKDRLCKVKSRLDGRSTPIAILLLLSACGTTPPAATNAPSQNLATSEVAPLNPPDAAREEAPPLIAASRQDNIRSEKKLSKRYISFAPNELSLDEANRKKLHGYAQELKNRPKTVVVIKAFSYGAGSRAYTLAALENQLRAVSGALQESGIQKTRIRQVLMGQRFQKKFCPTQECSNGYQIVEIDWKD